LYPEISAVTRPGHQGVTVRALGLAGLVAAGLLVVAGCATDPRGILPFARSAAPAALQLTVKAARGARSVQYPSRTRAKRAQSRRQPAGGGLARASHALEASIPTTATSLSLEIGNREDPDFIAPPPFDVSGEPDEQQEIAIGGIPPGLEKRVAFFARDAGGQVVASGEFFLDFFPGEIASNVVDLASVGQDDVGAGGGAGAAVGGPAADGSPPPDIAPTAPPEVPAEVFFVCETGGDRLVQINLSTGARTVLFQFAAGTRPFDVRRDNFGNFIVSEEAAGNVVKISAATHMRTVLASGLSTPRGLVVDQNCCPDPGNDIVVCESGSAKVTRIRADGSTTANEATFVPGDAPFGLAIFSSGFFPITLSGVELLGFLSGGSFGDYFDFTPVTPSPRIPGFVAIEADNKLLVGERGSSPALVRITLNPGPPDPPVPAANTRTVIFSFPDGQPPGGIFVEEATGNFVVCESVPATLARITPGGMRTQVFAFPAGSEPTGIAK
jgi:hypothetical protein